MCTRAGHEVIKLFLAQLMEFTAFILLINVKMPTIVGILTFISRIKIVSILIFMSRINTTHECFEQEKNHYFQYFFIIC